MIRTLASNTDNDLIVDPNDNLRMLTGLAAVAADCRSAMQAQLGEMVFAQDRGIPTLATIWDRYNPAQFEAAGRRALLRIADVLSVESLVVVRDSGTVRYTATIRTIYGETAVNAGL